MATTGISSIVSTQIAGFDVATAVDGILSVQQNEIDQLKKKQDDITARQDLLNQFSSDLQTLRSTAMAMADSASFFSYAATLSSNNASVPASNLLDVSGTDAVSAGSHTVVVNRVASALRISSSAAVTDGTGAAITDPNVALNYTASTFQINGTTISVAATDSLQDIADKINQANTGASATGVSAAVVKTTSSDYRLVLTADSTGSTGFTLSGAALNSGGALAGLNLGAVASDAAVKDAATGLAVSSDTAALNLSGSFTINGTAVTVNAADSLSTIASTINGLGIGVKASVVRINASDYRLALQGDATATTPATTITLAAGTGGVLSGLNLTAGSQTAASLAADAELTVDGLSITRSSNTIDDIISGVTFNLKQADPSTTLTLDINVDTSALQSNVQAFVDAYNTVMGFINDQYKFDPNTNSNGILADDPLLGTIQSQLAGSLLQTVPGLASDRNSLAAIGIEPDAQGVLSINHTLFDNFLNNSPDAIRDVFVASGTSTNNALQFLATGFNTPSGTYDVNITQAAVQESRTGSINLTSGIGAGNTDSLTISDGAHTTTVYFNGSGSQGTGDGLSAANAADGSSIDTIVSALNSEFARSITETRVFSTALTAGGSPATSANTFSDLGVGVAAGDVITISGTSRTGASINSSFTVLDPARDTLSELLSAIQVAFDQKVVATIDSSGHIQVTDASSGDSQLRVSLTSDNAGGGSLSFGTDTGTGTTEGRYPMSVTASNDGTGKLKISASSYGPQSGLSVSDVSNLLVGAPGTITTIAGQDVAGTIGGASANGSGQMLTGTSGNVDGMSILYTGTATGVVGSITLGVGVGAAYDGLIDTYTNSYTGLIASDVASLQSDYDSLTAQIDALQRQMDLKRETLTKSFNQMQNLLAQLQKTGDFLTSLANAQQAKK
ncbi:MAG: flagellar hook-associated protein [Zetaproteobacteria bacterium]|nr:MAG: flagellar hook-associated protein [Zetaproteobacteria bacterium]